MPQDLPFAAAARILGWQSQEEGLLEETTLRNLVRRHGQIIQQAQQAHVTALLQRTDLDTLTPQLGGAWGTPRRRAGWPQALNEAVDCALIAQDTCPPHGVSVADWERVLWVRREEASGAVRSAQELRCLGPQLAQGEVLATVDEVLTRKPQKRCFWELRTARIVTPQGTRYLSGTGESFVLLLSVFLQVCLGRHCHLRVIADGARWIRTWYAGFACLHSCCSLLLDWYHLCKKCRDLASMICRGSVAKKRLLKSVLRFLWSGQVREALVVLESYRPEAKNVAKLEELMGYLGDRSGFIPDYGKRRRECSYIGSGHVEKTNDLLVAQRQKGHGMHWSLESSEALMVLRTLMLNHGWERYWRDREVLPLIAG